MSFAALTPIYKMLVYYYTILTITRESHATSLTSNYFYTKELPKFLSSRYCKSYAYYTYAKIYML